MYVWYSYKSITRNCLITQQIMPNGHYVSCVIWQSRVIYMSYIHSLIINMVTSWRKCSGKQMSSVAERRETFCYKYSFINNWDVFRAFELDWHLWNKQLLVQKTNRLTGADIKSVNYRYTDTSVNPFPHTSHI